MAELKHEQEDKGSFERSSGDYIVTLNELILHARELLGTAVKCSVCGETVPYISMLSHLSALFGLGILLPLVVYLAMRHDSEYVAENAKEALNFHISLYLYLVCCIPLVFILIGIPMMVLITAVSFVLAILAAVKASDGRCYRYPLTIRLVR